MLLGFWAGLDTTCGYWLTGFERIDADSSPGIGLPPLLGTKQNYYQIFKNVKRKKFGNFFWF
jgi:hypothetical protein